MLISTIDSKKQLEVNDEVFNYPYNEGLIHQVVTTYLNNARSGNSAQKTRSEVRGGGKKPWKQKGTGRARAGTIRSPIWRSGGVTFASKKRDYTKKINKKMYKRAIRSIISELIRLERFHVVEDFKCETHKTKDFLLNINKLSVSNAFLVSNDFGVNEYLGARNLIDFDLADVGSLDPYRLLRYENVVFTEEALKDLEEGLL